LISVSAVVSSKSWDSTVVVQSASQRIISSGVPLSRVDCLQVVVAVVQASLVAGVDRWAGGEDLLAVVNANIISANSVTVGRSVGAVNQLSSS
jgi:hypothetical protein